MKVFPKHCIFNSNTAKSNQNITLITLNVYLIRILSILIKFFIKCKAETTTRLQRTPVITNKSCRSQAVRYNRVWLYKFRYPTKLLIRCCARYFIMCEICNPWEYCYQEFNLWVIPFWTQNCHNNVSNTASKHCNSYVKFVWVT